MDSGLKFLVLSVLWRILLSQQRIIALLSPEKNNDPFIVDNMAVLEALRERELCRQEYDPFRIKYGR